VEALLFELSMALARSHEHKFLFCFITYPCTYPERTSMNNLLAFLLSTVISLLSYALIAIWYVVPRLSKQPRVEALIPLILLHTFRTVGLVFLFPQVMGGALPPGFATPAAYGDLLTTGLALLAACTLRFRPGMALPLVWLFNLVGIADLVFAMYKGAVLGLPSFHLGVAWLLLTVYVPLLLVGHIIVFWILLRTAPSAQAMRESVAL
jgi:hypothetical protein